MRIKAHNHKFAFVGVALALSFTILAATHTANASVLICEGETANQPAGSPVPNNAHFVRIGTGSLTGVTAHCATTSVSVTDVYDGSCNGASPCVITSTGTGVIALDNKCTAAETGTQTASIPGTSLADVATGPLQGCRSAAAFFPFKALSQAYIVSAGTVTTTPGSRTACKAAGSGGISRCVSLAP